MLLWKKTVGENRVDCSTVMVIDRKRPSTRRLEMSRWKKSVGRRAELARRNILLDEIRDIGRGLIDCSFI